MELEEEAVVACDPLASGPMEKEAAEYLRRHRIPQLLENLTSALVYHRPDNPRDFMREHIEQLLKAKTDPSVQAPSLVDESNVESVFGMLDLAGKGSVSHQQYLDAMNSLGVSEFSNSDPPGAGIDRIGRETFLTEANSALRDSASTYSED